MSHSEQKTNSRFYQFKPELKFIWLGFAALLILISNSLFVSSFIGFVHQGNLNTENKFLLYTNTDDIVYNSVITSPTICLNNITSTISESGCRIWLLWWPAMLIYQITNSLNFSIIAFRLLLIIFFVFTLNYVFKSFTPEKLQTKRNLFIFLGLSLFGSISLFLIPYLPGHPGINLIIALTAYPTNFFSWVMSLLVIYNFYSNRLKTERWWLVGLLAGIWIFIHPFFVYFWLSFAVIWLCFNFKLALDNIWSTIALFLPTFFVGCYYLYLKATNVFFQFHLTTNTQPIDWMSWGSILIIITFIMITLWYFKHKNCTPAVNSFILLWLGLSILWVSLPTTVAWRQYILFQWPLALIIYQFVINYQNQTKKGLHYWLINIYLLFLIVGNILYSSVILGAHSFSRATSNTRSFALTQTDNEVGKFLESNYSNEFIASDYIGFFRFSWKPRLKIINSHFMESPDYYKFIGMNKLGNQNLISCAEINSFSMNKSFKLYVLFKPNNKIFIKKLKECSWLPEFENSDWVVLKRE